MKKIRVYLDTSVISYLDQIDSPKEMEQTSELWEIFKTGKYEVIISTVALDEINDCKDDNKRERLSEYISQIDYKKVINTKETDILFQQIKESGILAKKHLSDMRHIAFAIQHNCDIILSWNFKHLVNIKTINGIREIPFSTRYNRFIEIYAPFVLLETEDE